MRYSIFNFIIECIDQKIFSVFSSSEKFPQCNLLLNKALFNLYYFPSTNLWLIFCAEEKKSAICYKYLVK